MSSPPFFGLRLLGNHFHLRSFLAGMFLAGGLVVADAADSADTNNPAGQYVLARRYARGDGVPQDFNRAAEWCRKAADQGDELAQYTLGNIYSIGRGLPKDMAQATHWWRKAADQNLPQAQDALGQHFFWSEASGTNSTPQPTNYIEAAKWLRKAAEQGLAAPMNNLAYLYDHGFGVAPDLAEAAKWYRTAAELGNARAQGNYGLMCEDGRGARRDPIEAYKWFKLSADQRDSIGVRYARQYVEKELLTPQEFAEANRRIATFRERANRSRPTACAESLDP